MDEDQWPRWLVRFTFKQADGWSNFNLDQASIRDCFTLILSSGDPYPMRLGGSGLDFKMKDMPSNDLHVYQLDDGIEDLRNARCLNDKIDITVQKVYLTNIRVINMISNTEAYQNGKIIPFNQMKQQFDRCTVKFPGKQFKFTCISSAQRNLDYRVMTYTYDNRQQKLLDGDEDEFAEFVNRSGEINVLMYLHTDDDGSSCSEEHVKYDEVIFV